MPGIARWTDGHEPGLGERGWQECDEGEAELG